jgi:omega-hydroxy-beta-dihydromenaquinone-9 sulfotransferase
MPSPIEMLRAKLMNELQRNYVTASVPLPDFIKQPFLQLDNLLYGQDLNQITIEKPIFIIGCHRSGTTILYDTMAQHPDLAYFTNGSAFLPNIPVLSHKIGEMFGLNQVELERFIEDGINYSSSTPSEGIRIWENYLPTHPGFNHHLDESYENLEMEAYLTSTIQKHLKMFNRKRFLNKNPDNSLRMRYIKKLFPDAYFVHIVRDGRAVGSSLIRTRQKAVDFFGPDHPHVNHYANKGWSDRVNDNDLNWGDAKAKTVGIIWSEFLKIINEDQQFIDPDHFMEMRFEDFVENPLGYYEKIMNFCGLDWSESVQAIFEVEAKKISMGGRNASWQKAFTPEELTELNQVIEPMMKQYHYDI